MIGSLSAETPETEILIRGEQVEKEWGNEIKRKLCIFQVSLSHGELNLKIISKNLKLASQVATVFCSSRLSCGCGSSSSTLSGKGNTGDNQGSMQRRNSCS